MMDDTTDRSTVAHRVNRAPAAIFGITDGCQPP
jgi:hypothetical protein